MFDKCKLIRFVKKTRNQSVQSKSGTTADARVSSIARTIHFTCTFVLKHACSLNVVFCCFFTLFSLCLITLGDLTLASLKVVFTPSLSCFGAVRLFLHAHLKPASKVSRTVAQTDITVDCTKLHVRLLIKTWFVTLLKVNVK